VGIRPVNPPTEAARVPRFWPLFAAALAVRLGVGVLGGVLALRPPDPYADPNTPARFRDEIRAGSARLAEPWYRFDAVWLMAIARDGYAGAEDPTGRVGVAFLPAMPATMAAADAVGLNPFWVGLLAANLAGAAGAAVLARLAARLTGDRGTGVRTFVLVLAFPTAFFCSAPYSESYGLLFTGLAASAWLGRRPVRAGLSAAAVSLARLTGVAIGCAALAWWACDDRTKAGLKRAVVVAVGSFAGLALFWAYLGWAVGDPFAGLKVQAAWGRRPLSVWNPWHAIESIYDPTHPRWAEALVVLGFAALGVRAWARRGTFWGVLTLVPVAQMMLSGTFYSGHRLILAAVPGFVELADLLRDRRRFLAVAGGFAAFQVVLLDRYVHWVFAG
jgi:hypothetical protein